MYLLSNSPLPNTPVPTPEVEPSHDHYYQHEDGCTATVRLELWSNGVSAIDLRKLGSGRPTLKEPCQKFGVKNLARAKEPRELDALRLRLRRLAEELGVAAGPAPLLFADTAEGAYTEGPARLRPLSSREVTSALAIRRDRRVIPRLSE